ncbi:hypothetical protein [Pseudacidovorax sp. RU35E]|uniref:hypothetical protein n=1 Tax=Pseudacidovorax sp. RU35E TaxID=1907403 RepID=UPI0009570574|nr:hypothetical protein [Pseudacidovorax sp. RU35E]SIQ39545.1 hypothetical protein SAMN05880557_103353 [Pseudacidovorax sp. RU35E]
MADTTTNDSASSSAATPARHAHIPGWGVDRERSSRPAVPMERTPPRLEGVHWTQPAQQPQTVEVLCSTERDSTITPIFGSTLPPQGASGGLRRAAFRFSENDLRHWLILLLADRTDMVEGVIDDLRRGHVPNVVAEMGLGAAWTHDRPRLVRKLAWTAGSAVLLCWLMGRKRGSRRVR